MLTPAFVRAHFALRNDTLYRIRSDGTFSPLSTVLGGRLVTKVNGVTYDGPSLAWTLVYGSTPMFPVALLSRKPEDMHEENLVPIRSKRLRFRFKETSAGFCHRLNPGAYFKTVEACQDDWLAAARRHYAVDVLWAVQQERFRDQAITHQPYVRPIKPVRKGPERSEPREARPPAPPAPTGTLRYWHKGQWVVVPHACHPADDWRKRCEGVLAGATSFRFNPETQMVEPVLAGIEAGVNQQQGDGSRQVVAGNDLAAEGQPAVGAGAVENAS